MTIYSLEVLLSQFGTSLLFHVQFCCYLTCVQVSQEAGKVKVKAAQSCPTLCDPTVYGILQARILEWISLPFSRGSSQPRDRTQVSHIAGGFFTN